MALRASTKILIGAILVTGLGYVGYKVIPTQLILRQQFEPIRPGEVNIIGVDTNAGFYIVVANQVAELRFGEQIGFESPDKVDTAGDDQKKRIPLRDMINGLNGDEKAMGRFVMILNNISDADLPAYPVVWKADDVDKALKGDKALVTKLETDINVKLDGSPLESIRMGAIQEGIVIETPTPIEVGKGGSSRTVVNGLIREEFRPRFMRELDRALSEKSALSKDLIRGYYRDAAQRLLDHPNEREDIRKSLESRISMSRRKDLAKLPQRLLDHVTVIVNDSFMEGGKYTAYQGNDERAKYDMTLNLNDEGRRRLWKYSALHTGEQLLVVWDGIAIAAPRIQHAIPFSEVQVKQITDQGLVEDTLAAIERLKQERTSKS